LREVEHRVLKLLDSEPCHRMKRTDMETLYLAKFRVGFEAACRPFGGSAKVMTGRPDAYIHVIGLGVAAEVASTHSYLRTYFLHAVRKILAAQPGEISEKSVPAADGKEFADLYRRRIGHPFSLTTYGVCHLADLFGSVIKAKQSVLAICGDRVGVSAELGIFVRNAADLIGRSEGLALAIEDFDERYVSSYGNYSVSDFTYKSILELFNEFSHEFGVLPRRGREMLSLSHSAGLRIAFDRIFDLVASSLDGMLPCMTARAAYIRKYGSDIGVALENLLGSDNIGSLCKSGNRNGACIVTFRFAEIDILYLTDSNFIRNMKNRVIALLFQQRPGKIFATIDQFLSAYSRSYGPECFINMVHVKAGMRPVLDFKNGAIALKPEIVTVVKLAEKILLRGEMSAADACAAVRFSKGADELRNDCRLIPNFVHTNKEGRFFLDQSGASYFFSLLPPQSAHESDDLNSSSSSSASSTTADAASQKKRRTSRFAAVFAQPISED
jgi:hypothetical protein